MHRYDYGNPGYSRRPSGRVIKRSVDICHVCGQHADQFHDQARCAERWLKQVDEEIRKSREGRS
jgi:hypothetical protein